MSARLFLPSADFLSAFIVPSLDDYTQRTPEYLLRNVEFWLLLSVITVFLIGSYGGYGHSPASGNIKNTSLAVCCYFATSFTMLTVAAMMGHPHAVSRQWTTAGLCLTPLLMAAARSDQVRRLAFIPHAAPANGAVIICYDHCPDDLITALSSQTKPLTARGILYLSSQPNPMAGSNVSVIPSISALLTLIQTQGVQNIVFMYQTDLETIPDTIRQDLLGDLLAYPAHIWLAINLEPQLPHAMMNRSGRYKLVPIGTDTLVSSLNFPKRLMDITLGVMLLALSVPLLVVITILVRLSGPGPVIFRQLRVGAHGQKFTVLKFRTMRHVNDPKFAQAIKNDARITPIGRLLRRSSLDEILQFVNVIRGDMSLVGPRPHAPETQVEGVNFENAVKLYRLRHRVKPGMTGLAQIRGYRGETSLLKALEQRISSDLEYIETWSIWLDIKIILRTLPAILQQKNAW